jgi:hypothetical protein
VSTGASAQGKVTGKLFWKVPYSLAGSTYVYQCGNHSSMVGNIVIQKPVSTITTSDIAEGSNLYYSNDRVRANVIALLPTLAGTGINIEANGQISSTTSVGSIAGLNTANVSESASNLYYTNARVYSNVVSLLSGYTGDINAGNITTSTIIANSIIGTALGGSVTGANLISTNNISSLNWIGLYTANVAEFGNTTTGNVFFTNTRAIGAFSAGSGISISANGLISSTATGVVTANSIVGLNTSNIAEGSNLYYTNARVYANVIGLLNAKANVVDLTTANVNEFGSNLYYTNARVYANVIALLPTYTGNVTAGNVTTTTLYANSIIGSAVGGYITGANLISANNISSLNWIGLYTANVVETSGNLYFTNARVVSNVIALLPSLAGSGISIDTNGVISASLGGVVFANTVIGLTTANVSESASNLYYTNARVYANVIGVINALTTANVAESTSNLYYTNTRVYGNVIALLPTYTGNVNAGNVTTTTLYANSIVGAAVGGYITGANLISTNNISSLNWIGLYTANVIESASNLYFTNSRVYANVTNILQSLNTNIVPLVDSIYDLGSSTRRFRDLYLSGSTLRIGNISLSQGANGGLAITSSAGNLAILSDTISANSWVGLYSSNVVESSTNLFYSNARVYSNVIAVLSTLAGNGIAIDANGVISSTLTGTVSANTVRDLTTSNIAEGSNLYYTNVRVYSNVVSMLSGYTGNINAGNITTSILIANSIVGTALGGSITGANLISTNNISSFNWIGLYTANAIESASNLYYTNARVFAALSSGTGVDYSNTTGVISIGQNVSPNASVTFANLTVTGTASFYGNVTTYSSNNLSISDNMIYLNNGSTTSNPDLGFAGNYNDGSYKHTGFFRDATDGTWKVFDNYSPEPDASQFIDTAHASFRLANLSATTVTANIVGTTGSFTGNISAGNVIATGSITANGLIIRGINVTDSVLAGNITANTSTSDTVTANTITANIWNNLYTANVVETAGNLYFTNTRVVAALVAGDNITIESNGRISSSGGGGGLTQLTVSSSQTLTGGNKNYTLSSSVNNANSIIVSINGMVQAPAIDYTLNGGQGLQFSANTTANALIEVKYYGYSALSPNVAVVSSSVTIPTVAGQTAYMMGANVTQAQSIMVALDGLIQRPTVDYTVNNTTITMIPAPPEGSNIEIRFFGQEAVALAGAQYTTAYISNSRTYAGGSANLNLGSNVLLARNIIVNIDGVTQIPDLNYTVSGSTLSFGTSVPAIGSLVEVKFFGAEAFNANLTQAMVTAVLPTVLSNDTLVRQIIRSSAYAFSRIFY